MRRQSYYEKLRDPRWQRRRLEVMSRAEFKCQDCGADTQTLNVHHARYVRGREPWEYPDHELACLCEACHAKRHLIEDEIRTVLSGEDSFALPYAHALICGWMGVLLEDFVEPRYASGHLLGDDINGAASAYLAGQIASRLGGSDPDELGRLLNLLDAIGVAETIAVLSAGRLGRLPATQPLGELARDGERVP